MKKVKKLDKDGNEVEVETLSVEEQNNLTRDELAQRAKPVSQGGTRPDGLSREEWRTSQGSYYDDDRC
jgi:hypothetical protein